MRRFAYARDPACLLAIAAYATNRWLVPATWKGPFLRGHFDDLWLIPAALPLLLWLQRLLGTRHHDEPPRWAEIFAALAVWTLAAEVVAPHLTTRAVADPGDVAAYAAGALVAVLWWHRR